ncbi:MAG: peptidoglycan DD-metalloendopeptidase family protein [Gammaproteobacteria bacterium]|nr:peptidoglycan DD-metalloendopeptidase family protein [Gammaproteobacteria bacterium]MBU1722849.1 peptidoglycan DD-metalloendopeptidase family protein [Gammaproteobacteria bacterium]
MKRYNLPVGGIEVVIPGDYKPKQKLDHTTTKRIKPARPASAATAAASPHKHLRYIATRTLLLTCGLATLGNIPVYSMINSPEEGKILNLATQLDNNSPAQVMKDLNLPAVAVESFSGYAVDVLPDARQGNWIMRSVESEDTLETIISKLELSKTAKALLENSNIQQELKDLKTGAHILVQIVDDQLLQLIYAKGKTNAYIVSATDEGYAGKWESEAFAMADSRIAFTVKHSLQKDGKAAGLSNSVIRQISQVFHKDMDFRKGVKVGDKVGVIFEDFRYQGESIYTDKILAAEYTSRKNTWQRIRFTLEDGKTDYFRPDGDSELKRTAFDRKPIEGGRMSSGFGMRRHPVFGLRKAHAGTDFAAPRGTPIHATADGSVKFLGRQGGYGNVVELRHRNGITTLYGHMSAFKEGLGSGEKVTRGDVIGYVGSTGTSTGNHVHYEFRINGEPQNPMTADLPEVGIMSATEMRKFKNFASSMTQQLADLRKLASLDKPLKDQSGG